MSIHAYPFIPFSGLLAVSLQQQHEDAFNALMDDFDIPVRQQIVLDDTPEYAIWETELELGAEPVVMGATSRGFLPEILTGSMADRTIDTLDGDVLVVKPDEFQSPFAPD